MFVAICLKKVSFRDVNDQHCWALMTIQCTYCAHSQPFCSCQCMLELSGAQAMTAALDVSLIAINTMARIMPSATPIRC